MAITEVGSASNGDTSAAISVTHGLTILTNDVVIALINSNTNAAVSDNNGATALDYDFSTDYHGTSAHFGVWSRVAGGSEPASYNFTIASSQRWSIILRVFRGVDTGNIYDVAPAAANFDENGTATPSAPSITIANAGAMGVFTAGLDWSNGVFSGQTDGYATEVEQQGDQSIASYIKIWAATGATTTIECTLDSGADENCASQFSLKPASAAGAMAIPLATAYYNRIRTVSGD